MRKSVERYLWGTPSEVEEALMETHPQEWLGELWTLYLESEEKRQCLLTEKSTQMAIISEMGREGRTLATIRSAQFDAAFQNETRRRLAIERAIEATWRTIALRKGEEMYRATLVEYLLSEIELHRNTCPDEFARPENERLWSLLKDR